MSAKKISDGEFHIKELTIVNKSGIHARPAAMFVKIANRFGSDIPGRQMQPAGQGRTALKFPHDFDRLLCQDSEDGLGDIFGKMGIDHQSFRR